VLEAKPAAGRFFKPEDEQAGHELVAVISYGFWERRFARESSVVGQHVSLNARPFTIVGVAPRGFEGVNYARTDVWIPVVTEIFHTQENPFNRGNTFVFGLGRLKPGVSMQQAQAEMEVVASRLQQAYPDDNKDAGAKVVAHNPFSVLPDAFYAFVGMLSAIAFLVLVIACANVTAVCLAQRGAQKRDCHPLAIDADAAALFCNRRRDRGIVHIAGLAALRQSG
jgi:putative ABC transport system permease protein